MCWCLHLLYNIVQIRFAYYACNFAIQIQSVVFSANMAYFMRGERLADENQQRRWQEIIAKQSSYHNTVQKQMQRLLANTEFGGSLASPAAERYAAARGFGTVPRSAADFTRDFPLNRDRTLPKNTFGTFGRRPVGGDRFGEFLQTYRFLFMKV